LILMKISIVGSQENKWEPEQKFVAKDIIRQIIMDAWHKYEEDLIIVSGHCPYGGVDIWVEDIVKIYNLIGYHGIIMQIHSPEVRQWLDKDGKIGYKTRNMKIAESDILYDIEPKGKRSGGTWTMEYAKQLGKEIHLIEVE